MLHSGVLKTARLEVASHLPEIASDLYRHEDAVLCALQKVVAENNVDPAEVSPIDFNKTERHTYVMFGFDQMMRGFVEGEDCQAQFIDPRSWSQQIIGNPFTLWGKKPSSYQRNLVGMMIARRDEVKREFTEGVIATHNWWQFANARYTDLGRKHLRYESNNGNNDVIDESINLDFALSGSTLAHFTKEHAKLIHAKRGYIALGKRVQAAHDLVHLPLALAGLHVANIRSRQCASLSSLNGRVFFNKTLQRYGIERPIDESDNWDRVFYVGEKTATATLGCPVGDELKTATHAAINVGERYGLFRF